MDQARMNMIEKEVRRTAPIWQAIHDVFEWPERHTMEVKRIEELGSLAKWWRGWTRDRDLYVTGEVLGKAVFRAMVEDEEFRKFVMDRLPSPPCKRHVMRAAG